MLILLNNTFTATVCVMSLKLHNVGKGHMGEHVCLHALRFPLSANHPPGPEKMFTLFNFQSLLSSCPSPPLPLCRFNSQGVVYIALSWLVLVTMWSSCCVCKSTPCRTHQFIATCGKTPREKKLVE